MVWPKLLFWFSLAILFYCFIGYTILLWVLIKLKKFVSSGIKKDFTDIPPITFIVAAYNEKDFIQQKIENSLSLKYPKDKLQYIFITDGSDDGTDELVKQHTQITLLHQPQRQGKSVALNRAMDTVVTPVVVFSDANTFINEEALLQLVKHYDDEKVGGVSGEKKISGAVSNTGLGEGLYWRYESFIKMLEANFYSLVGSAGELFSIRTSLFKPIPEDIILDDFYTALKINEQGYKIVYEPSAAATETPSASLAEERKRKIRIAGGAFQIAFKFPVLHNFFKHPLFAFQFFSHKILRWFAAPVCIILFLLTNFLLRNESLFFEWCWYAQLLFYTAALLGWVFHKGKNTIPAFYFPFYFLFMNYCTVLGWFRYLSGRQNVLWEKSKRETNAKNK